MSWPPGCEAGIDWRRSNLTGNLTSTFLARRGPLAGRYPAAAAMVIFALVPYLVLSAALQPLTPTIARQLHMSLQGLSLGSGLANAGYAVGTVLSVQLAQHLPQRRMLVIYAALLAVGSVLAAAAQSPAMFVAGHVLQGFCTSLLLIAAVPPLALGFGLERFRETAIIMNLCIFGAVALGPTLGGIQANAHAWRPLFWAIAGLALLALVLSVLTFEDVPPADRSAPREPRALALAGAGCVAAFFGSSELLTHRFVSVVTLAPLLGGLALIIALIVIQYRAKHPLLIVRSVLTSTIPVSGILIALCAAAASVSATVLTGAVLSERFGPLHVGLLYLPEFAGAVLTAALLGVLLDKRQMQYLPLAGMAFLAAGIGVFLVEVPANDALALTGAGLTGIGLGATVAPALFAAGFSLPSASLQRVFAIVELLRAVAAFMIAPVFVHLAATVGGNLRAGTAIALWVGLGIAVGGAAIAVAIYLLGGAQPRTPDLERFLAGASPAWYSPPLLARLRRRGQALAASATGPAEV